MFRLLGTTGGGAGDERPLQRQYGNEPAVERTDEWVNGDAGYDNLQIRAIDTPRLSEVRGDRRDFELVGSASSENLLMLRSGTFAYGSGGGKDPGCEIEGGADLESRLNGCPESGVCEKHRRLSRVSGTSQDEIRGVGFGVDRL